MSSANEYCCPAVLRAKFRYNLPGKWFDPMTSVFKTHGAMGSSGMCYSGLDMVFDLSEVMPDDVLALSVHSKPECGAITAIIEPSQLLVFTSGVLRLRLVRDSHSAIGMSSQLLEAVGWLEDIGLSTFWVKAWHKGGELSVRCPGS